MIDILNKSINELLNLLEEDLSTEKRKQQNIPFKGLGEPIVLDTKVSDYIESKTDFRGKTISKFRVINKLKVGINEKHYSTYLSVCNKIHNNGHFNKVVNKEFIEVVIFKWLTDKYILNISEDPIEYLKREINENIDSYTYFFVINNIAIESDFKIGECLFFHVDNKFIEEEKIQANLKDKEFDKVTSFIHDKIILQIETKGVGDKAMELAQYKTELMLNILKIFLLEESMDYTVELPEFNYQCLGGKFNQYLVKHEKESFFSWNAGMFRAKNSGTPTHISNKKLEKELKNGMRNMIYYFSYNEKDELYGLLVSSVNALGEAFSIFNFYERAVKLISLLESIFIRGNKGGGQSIIKQKVIPKFVKSDIQEDFKRIINLHYKVRDRYLHHKEEIEIDYNDFYQFQFFIQRLLLKIMAIQNDTKIKTKQELLDYFEIT